MVPQCYQADRLQGTPEQERAYQQLAVETMREYREKKAAENRDSLLTGYAGSL